MAKKKFDKRVSFTLLSGLFDCTYFIDGEFVHGYKVCFAEMNDAAQTLNVKLTKCTSDFYDAFKDKIGELYPKRIAFDENGRAVAFYSYDDDDGEDEENE